MIDGSKRGLMQVKNVRNFLDSVLDEDIHTKRIASLANATLGVMTGASLGVAVIGKSLAQARGLLPKHAIKQVDRLLSNPRIEAWDVFASWVPEMVGPRTDIVVAMDWTDYDADGQATLALKLVTRHGRATPLIWLSVLKDELSTARNDYEDVCLRRLAKVLPDDVKVTLLAGFADTKLFGFLDELGFDYVIRLKGNTNVGAADGLTGAGSQLFRQGAAGVGGSAEGQDEFGRALSAGDFNNDGQVDVLVEEGDEPGDLSDAVRTITTGGPTDTMTVANVSDATNVRPLTIGMP